MSNNINPAEIYSGTTWELLPDNKFLKTGATPLQQGGSNSIKIAKANLPTDKLQVESFNLTRGTMDITGKLPVEVPFGSIAGAFIHQGEPLENAVSGTYALRNILKFQASRSWTGSTSSASPYTSAMGNGTPLTINPEHIIVKAWKRLS